MTNVKNDKRPYKKNIRKGNIIFLDMLSLHIIILYMKKKVILFRQFCVKVTM